MPFALTGGTCIGTGKGDQLEKIKLEEDVNFIILKPRSIAVASSWAYSAYDEQTGAWPKQSIESSLNSSLAGRLSQGFLCRAGESIEGVSQLFGNDLESAVFDRYPVLREIKEFLLKEGCAAAHMTGSGSAIYGVLSNRRQGDNIMRSPVIQRDHWGPQENCVVDAWLAKSLNHGVRMIKRSEDFNQWIAPGRQ